MPFLFSAVLSIGWDAKWFDLAQCAISHILEPSIAGVGGVARPAQLLCGDFGLARQLQIIGDGDALLVS